MNEARTPDSPLLVQGMQTRAQRRERIATAALQGLLAGNPDEEDGSPQSLGRWAHHLAIAAAAYADALMAELDKP